MIYSWSLRAARFLSCKGCISQWIRKFGNCVLSLSVQSGNAIDPDGYFYSPNRKPRTHWKRRSRFEGRLGVQRCPFDGMGKIYGELRFSFLGPDFKRNSGGKGRTGFDTENVGWKTFLRQPVLMNTMYCSSVWVARHRR